MSEPKQGRGRRYRLALETERFGAHAKAVAMLDEQTARLADLIADLPDEGGNHVPEWGENSIWWLCLHMTWGEASWLARAAGGQNSINPEHGHVYRRDEVLAAFAATREATKVYLGDLQRGQATFTPVGPFGDLGEMLEHLNWHWTYHSGQVGLMRRLVGHGYRWRFAEQEAAQRP